MAHPLLDEYKRYIALLKEQRALVLDNKYLTRSGAVMATGAAAETAKAEQVAQLDAQIAEYQSLIAA